MANVEIQSNIKLGLKDILNKKKQQTAGDAEIQLLKKINTKYPVKLEKRYQFLTTKMDKGTLSDKEQQELIDLSNQFETFDAKRLEYIIALAQLRKQPLDSLLKELALATPPTHV